jgi:hypothetical protein
MPAMPVRPALLAVPATLALAATVAAAPAQAVVTFDPQHPLLPCYVSVSRQHRQVLDIRARATPLSRVLVRVARKTATVDADRFGNVFTTPSAPFQRRGERAFTVSLTELDDNGAPVNTTSTETRVTDLAMKFHPGRSTRHRVRFHGRGFTLNQPIWAHYLFRGKVRRTVRFAEGPTGACGRFSVRRPEIPVLTPHPGRWLLQVDQQRRYSREPASVLTRTFITVRLAGA